MKQTKNQRKKLTVWVRMPAPSSWRHTSTRKATCGSTYLNCLKKGMSFIMILMMMAIWLASAASSAFAQEKTNVDLFTLNTDRTLYGKLDGSQITFKPMPGYNTLS